MITFRQHISLMDFIVRGETTADFLKSLKPIESVDFLRSSEDTYPVGEKTKLNKKLFKEKTIYQSIEQLVLGQFIMLEQIITGKTKLPDHKVDLEILKLIIRPKHHIEFDNENIKDETDNEEYILSLDLREVYYVLENFISSRNQTLFKDFSGVFYAPVDEDDTDEEIEEDVASDNAFNQQWYWYSVVRLLSGEDIHRYEETYMLPMRTVLPEMSYLAQKNKIESAEQRKSQMMQKL